MFWLENGFCVELVEAAIAIYSQVTGTWKKLRLAAIAAQITAKFIRIQAKLRFAELNDLI
ncbi:MAG: hypothetical protein M3209_14170 [Acidobacteriota bacterium]|nr:hypothetical protein [Acidobacteriota bacterium]